jgi:hypothetical protein
MCSPAPRVQSLLSPNRRRELFPAWVGTGVISFTAQTRTPGTLVAPYSFGTDSWLGFIRCVWKHTRRVSQIIEMGPPSYAAQFNASHLQEGVNSLREIVRLDSLAGDDCSNRPKLAAVAESLQSAIESTASGAIALRANCLAPLLEMARLCLSGLSSSVSASPPRAAVPAGLLWIKTHITLTFIHPIHLPLPPPPLLPSPASACAVLTGQGTLGHSSAASRTAGGSARLSGPQREQCDWV